MKNYGGSNSISLEHTVSENIESYFSQTLISVN